jgi:hypothetical protein
VGGTVLVLVIIGAGVAVADPPAMPPWVQTQTGAFPWTSTQGTGWVQNPRIMLSDPRPSRAVSLGMWFSEAYWTGSHVAVDVNYTPTGGWPTGEGSWFSQVRLRIFCETLATGRILEGPIVTQHEYGWTAQSEFMANGGVKRLGLSASTCGSGQRPRGVSVQVTAVLVGSGGVQTPFPGPRLIWFDDQSLPPVQPDVYWCRTVFGPDYVDDTVAIVNGQSRSAGEVGCREDYLSDPGLYTDFSVVCRGAPRAEWLSFSWLGPWIGHYSECLYVPQGGWDRDGEIAMATQAGWFGEVEALSDDLGDGASLNGGGCGVAVTDLPGPMGSISTCSLGAVWPSNMRNLAGLAVVGMSSVACLFVILRYLRIGGAS